MALAFTTPAALAQESGDAAAETPQKQAKKEKQKKADNPIAKAIKKVKKIKGRLNEKADYYIFLYSASWCGPCCKEMPEIVDTYKAIKKSGKVDIILFCQDKTTADAKNFVKQFGIKFLTVMGNDEKCAQVPGHAPAGGIPHCNIVDRSGRKITSGHPANVIPNWESHTIGNEDS